MALDPADIALMGGLAGGFALAITLGATSSRRKRRRALTTRLAKLKERTGAHGVRAADGRTLPATPMRALVAEAPAKVAAPMNVKPKAKPKSGPASTTEVHPDTRCVLCHDPLGTQSWLPCSAAQCGRIAHKNCSTMVEGCPVCQTPY